MKTPIPRASAVTDPIARAIEGHLCRIERNGGAKLKVSVEGEESVLTFGKSEARGETYEIALVRFARALLDDAEFKTELMSALRVMTPAECGELAAREGSAR